MNVELLHDLDRETGRVLLVDGVEQSYVDVADPRHLEFEYMQHFALVLDAVLPAPAPVTAVHLGGGACTMPRWVAATRPGSTQVVIESSPEILAAVAPLGPVPGCRIVQGAVPQAIAPLPPASADLVVWDLYDGPRLVTAALTLDVVVAMHRLLRPIRGVLLLNVSDATPFDAVRPVLAALRASFADVALLAEPSTLRGRRSGNCVLVAADLALPVPTLVRRGAGAPVRARVLSGNALTAFIAGAVPATRDAPLPEPDQALGRGFL